MKGKQMCVYLAVGELLDGHFAHSIFC